MELVIGVLIGLGAGLLSGLFGIGGGLVIVPALILLAGFTAKQAAGTSLAALVLPIGIILAAIEYWRAGHVDVRMAAFIMVGLVIGAFIGARLAIGLPNELIQRSFGVLLLVVGMRLALFAP